MTRARLYSAWCFLTCLAATAFGQDAVFPFSTHLDYSAGNDNPALEIKFGVLPEDPERLVAFSLYNQSPGNNVLAAHVLDPPYDGSSFTFFDNIDSGPLFSVGSGCYLQDEGANAAVFPYVKLTAGGAGQLRTATFNGNAWSKIAQSGPPSNDFATADCDNAGDKLILSGHDRQQQRVVVFEDTGFNGDDPFFSSRFCVGGSSDCLPVGGGATNLAGPFEGGLKPGLSIGKRFRSPPPDVERNPWVVVAQSDSGDLFTLVLEVNPANTSEVSVVDSCSVADLFTPDGNPAPNKTVVVKDLQIYGADAFDGVVLENGVRIGAVRQSGSQVLRYAGRVDIDAAGNCEMNVSEVGTMPTGALGFQGVDVFPYLNGGAGLMFNEFIETDVSWNIQQTISDYPGDQADGGPRSGCKTRFDAAPGVRDAFLGAGAHSDGGLYLFAVRGPITLRDSFERPVSESFPSITDAEAFATCH